MEESRQPIRCGISETSAYQASDYVRRAGCQPCRGQYQQFLQQGILDSMDNELTRFCISDQDVGHLAFVFPRMVHRWTHFQAIFQRKASDRLVIPNTQKGRLPSFASKDLVFFCFVALPAAMTSKPLTSSLVAAAQAWQDTKSDDDRRQLIAAANKVVEHLETPAETLARIGWGEPSRTAALQTAFELGLLEKLSDLPQTSQTLAEGTPADPALVGRIMKMRQCSTELRVCRTHTEALDRLLPRQ